VGKDGDAAMRILFVSNGLDLGGVETNLVRLTEELVARGHEVIVASGGGSLLSEIEAAGATHVGLSLAYKAYPSPRQLLADVRVLDGVLRHRRPDVVHVFSASTAVMVLLARTLGGTRFSRRHRLTVISSIMGLHAAPDEGLRAVQLRSYLTYLGADKMLLISPAIASLVRGLPVRHSRCIELPVVGIRLPDPVSQEAAAAVRAELRIDPDEQVVMTIGGLDPRKNHELFLRAAAEVLTSRPRVRFFVVGEGRLREALRVECAALGLQPSLQFLGARKDVPELLSITDVYVRPGIVEGFIGITVLEAQAVCTPVISFETEDVRPAITHGVSGWLVPPGDVHGLAQAIVTLLDDPNLASALGKGGRAQVERQFSMPVIVDGLEALYSRRFGAFGAPTSPPLPD